MGFPAYQPAPSLPVQAPIDLGPLQKILAAPNTKGLARTAAAQAAQQVGSQLAAIQQAQQGELAQAAGRAREINAASLASSDYLDHLGFAGRLRAALQQAGQDQAAFAQGFSGDLRQTAEADAAKLNQSIAAIGAPGSVPNADALANTVYGLGRIPADVLTASAPYVYAQAQTLPASLLAAGREQAVGALGAGQQAAAQYRPQIAAAIGSLPKLTQGILSDLTAAAEKARQDAIGNMFAAVKLQQDGRTEEATQAWRNAQIQGKQWSTYTAAYNHWADAKNTAAWRDQTAQNRADTLAETKAYHKAELAKPDISNTSGGGVYRTNKDGTITWLRQPSATEGTTGYDDAFGRRIQINADGSQTVMSAGQFTDPATHRVYTVDLKGGMTPITKGSKPSQSGGLTANEASGMLRVWHDGTKHNVRHPLKDHGKPKLNDQGVPVYVTKTETQGTKTYPEAVAALQGLGWSHTRAVKAANGFYAQGFNKRPYEGQRAYQVALKYARRDAADGVSFDDALQEATATGLLPADMLFKALLVAYKGKVSQTTFFGG